MIVFSRILTLVSRVTKERVTVRLINETTEEYRVQLGGTALPTPATVLKKSEWTEVPAQ